MRIVHVIRSYASLSPDERHLLWSSLVVVVTVRAGLTCMPYRRFRKAVARRSAVGSTGITPRRHVVTDPQRVVWAIATVSRHVPGASCLTQALASQFMLARHGQVSDVRIGVAKDERGQFEAHAWLEHQGRVILGDIDLHKYTPLPASF